MISFFGKKMSNSWKENSLSKKFFFLFFRYFMIFIFSSSLPIIFTEQLDNFEIKPGKCLKINVSVPNLRLFVGNIPKSKGKEEILDEFGKLTGKWTKKKRKSREKQHRNVTLNITVELSWA